MCYFPQTSDGDAYSVAWAVTVVISVAAAVAVARRKAVGGRKGKSSTALGTFCGFAVALFSVAQPYHGQGCGSLVLWLFATPDLLASQHQVISCRHNAA